MIPCRLLLLAATADAVAALRSPTRSVGNIPDIPAVRCLSFGENAAALLETAAGSVAEQAGARLLPIELPLPEDASPLELVGPCEEFAWVHVAMTFKECAAAKRHGATTIWLNEKAASTQGDFESTGFLGATIIDDFADAVCASAEELDVAVPAAQQAAATKAAEEEARAEREHYSSLEEDMLTRLPQWDAEALLPSGDDELTSPFAQPAPMGDAGLGLSMWDGQQEWQQPQPANGDAGADAATSSKFCTQCGTKLPVDAKFCSACGAKQVSSS